MYNALDPRWASTVVGCISIVLIPIPFVLKRLVSLQYHTTLAKRLLYHRYGPHLRRKSKYCPSEELQITKDEDEDKVENL